MPNIQKYYMLALNDEYKQQNDRRKPKQINELRPIKNGSSKKTWNIPAKIIQGSFCATFDFWFSLEQHTLLVNTKIQFHIARQQFIRYFDLETFYPIYRRRNMKQQ